MEMQVTQKAMSSEELAKMLRNMAEFTAKLSQNWDNYESLCRDAVSAAIEAGRQEERARVKSSVAAKPEEVK